MIDTLAIYNDLRKSLGDEAASKMAQIIQGLYQDLSHTVRKEDFDELKAVVQELAEAQRGTDARLGSLTERVEELAEAQKRTEARVEELAEAQKRTEARLNSLAERVEELAEAQKRTEARLNSLAERVEELAEAQKRTEARLNSLAERVEELAEAQKRTDARLDRLTERVESLAETVHQLAEAQTRTENRLEKLIIEHKKTREQLGGLSHTVGYRLEDEAIWALPALLKRDFGIEVEGELERGYIELSPGRYFEVNIWGNAVKDEEDLAILGEAKTQLKKKDVSDFLKRVSRLQGVTDKKIFPLLVTYQTSPRVQDFAQKEGVKIYFSFELKPPRS